MTWILELFENPVFEEERGKGWVVFFLDAREVRRVLKTLRGPRTAGVLGRLGVTREELAAEVGRVREEDKKAKRRWSSSSENLEHDSLTLSAVVKELNRIAGRKNAPRRRGRAARKNVPK